MRKVIAVAAFAGMTVVALGSAEAGGERAACGTIFTACKADNPSMSTYQLDENCVVPIAKNAALPAGVNHQTAGKIGTDTRNACLQAVDDFYACRQIFQACGKDNPGMSGTDLRAKCVVPIANNASVPPGVNHDNAGKLGNGVRAACARWEGGRP